jgi:hypothetical protein
LSPPKEQAPSSSHREGYPQTPDGSQIIFAQQSFAQIVPDGDLLAGLFYARLFQLEPAQRGSFPNDLSDQRGQLLYALVRAVRDLPSSRPPGNRVEFQPSQVVSAALLWMMAQGLAERFRLIR